MMRIIIPTPVDQRLERHLLQVGERLAFLAAQLDGEAMSAVGLLPIGEDLLDAADLSHLALTDECRAMVIRWAHERSAALVEVHSHPSWWPASMSIIDIDGLAEWVPHVRWRLPGRPYAAIVVAGATLDALVWDGTGVSAPYNVERSGIA